jgi:hypothetical protein
MRPHNINLDDGQYEILELLAELNPLGRPPVASMVRQAVTEFIERTFAADTSLRGRIEQQLKLKRPKLVSLRPGGNRPR